MLKKMIIMILLLCLILPIYQSSNAEYDLQAEDEIWNYLMEETQSEIITAGIMGYFKRESKYIVNVVHGSSIGGQEKCQKFTEHLYELNREEFAEVIHNSGGYGLGQWYALSYALEFYDFFNEHGYKYDSIEGQCKFMVWELKNRPELWEELNSITKPYYAGLIIGSKYDGADELGYNTIASMSKMIYKEKVG